MRGVAGLGPVAVLALGLGACSGPAELSLGTAVAPAMTMVYIAPDGLDGAPGTRARPLKRFDEALLRLRPGSTLTLLDGLYDTANGPLKAKCDDVTVFSGTDDAHRILITAETERAALLRGDGAHPPIDLENCRFWTLDGLRAESQKVTTPAAPEAGSVVVLRANDRDIVLHRLLASLPNPNLEANVLTIGAGSSDVLVEECELYDFHHNAVEATRAGPLTLRRNYVNSRSRLDAMEATRGDYGFLFEETHDVIAENNIVEHVHDGLGVLGRGATVQAPPGPPIATNRLLGNIVLRPSGVGFRVDSRCMGENPCPVSRTVIDTELANDLIIGGAAGVSNAGAVNTRIHEVTIVDAANGVLAVKEPQNVAIRSTWSTLNTIAIVQNTSFKCGPDEGQWLFDHCAAASSSDALFVVLAGPGNANGSIQNSVGVPATLRDCLIRQPGTNLGANVTDQYQDGVLMPGVSLWAAGNTFVGCGAVVADVNQELPGDPKTDSCRGVQSRLMLAACPP